VDPHVTNQKLVFFINMLHTNQGPISREVECLMSEESTGCNSSVKVSKLLYASSDK
jgi:hypothetical protein